MILVFMSHPARFHRVLEAFHLFRMASVVFLLTFMDVRTPLVPAELR